MMMMVVVIITITITILIISERCPPWVVLDQLSATKLIERGQIIHADRAFGTEDGAHYQVERDEYMKMLNRVKVAKTKMHKTNPMNNTQKKQSLISIISSIEYSGLLWTGLWLWSSLVLLLALQLLLLSVLRLWFAASGGRLSTGASRAPN